MHVSTVRKREGGMKQPHLLIIILSFFFCYNEPALSQSLGVVQSSGTNRVIAGGASFVIDFTNQTIVTFSGDGGPATEAGLSNPHDISFDSDGNLYIVDAGHHRIRKVDAETGIITTIVGNGNEGFIGDGGLATEASLSSPSDIAIDKEGHIYISDTANHRIRKVDKQTQIIDTVLGDPLLSPGPIIIDDSGTIYYVHGNSQLYKLPSNGNPVQIALQGLTLIFDIEFDSLGNILLAGRDDNYNFQILKYWILTQTLENIETAPPCL